ncbi:MAG TPA: DUF302 domain-containing protein [Thermomicrobiales bacterium]|nr:DUF302 domain-containing protein [Thermomicrobiales bacterium]
MSDEREPIGFGIEIEAPIDEAIERTKAALKTQGFGVLTEIDVRQTMRDKLGETFEPYVILGACNPQLAWRALQAEHEIGLLLPCNVIVHQHGDRSAVSVADPVAMMSLAPDNPAIAAVAAEARERLQQVVAALAAE